MKGIIRFIGVALMCLAATACQRIESGEVGLRQNFDKTYNTQELQPGSFNQTLFGSVLNFKVQDVPATVNDLKPQAADDAALADFDAQVIYSLNPSAVAELWIKESKSFHSVDAHGDILLMNSYMATVLRNAAIKAVREYPSLKLGDNRSNIEHKIKELIEESLKARGLDKSLNVSQVQVLNMLPAASILQSANDLVTAENALKRKAIEVETARKEAERIAALNANSKAIEYMQAQAQLAIADGIKAGKVHAVVVPYDFKGIVNVGK